MTRVQQKKITILMKQEMMGWHKLDHMQIICTSLQKDNHVNTSAGSDSNTSTLRGGARGFQRGRAVTEKILSVI